ncbi:hypothetical protein LZ30DRAFT_736085 [Colletotrichum cereale]|nr:hypothetical protein LZ30DRAFT_736085 [Colletotrichum cereale]
MERGQLERFAIVSRRMLLDFGLVVLSLPSLGFSFFFSPFPIGWLFSFLSLRAFGWGFFFALFTASRNSGNPRVGGGGRRWTGGDRVN